MIYRRVKERREKADGSATTGATTFTASTASPTPAACADDRVHGQQCLQVIVRDYTGSSTPSNIERQKNHFFNRKPEESVFQIPTGYPSWRTARVFDVETQNVSAEAFRLLKLSDQEKAGLIAFLRSLSGSVRKGF